MKKCDVEKIRIADYNYTLSPEKIARYPLEKRDSSKLLLFRNNTISTLPFSGIAAEIPEGSLIVFNNTRVIHARLIFEKNTGAIIEIFCLSPYTPRDYLENFQQRTSCSWHCMIGNAKRWKDGELHMQVFINNEKILLSARQKAKNAEDVVVEFSWNNPDFTFSELLEVAGKLPIPPYLNRASEKRDDETYQTIYSAVEGSVAAPTAGLHFTSEVMGTFREKGIHSAWVTLHVGAGTFKPVRSETIGDYDMHMEFISVSRETVQTLYENENDLIVVGTTSMRTVESLYYLGKKILLQSNIQPEELVVFQWEPYGEENPISPKLALKSIIDYLIKNNADRLLAFTQVMIVPGYTFHYPQALITNFHQPKSTLLLLIASGIGKYWRDVYDYALQNDYRFLSYGDSSLLWLTADQAI